MYLCILCTYVCMYVWGEEIQFMAAFHTVQPIYFKLTFPAPKGLELSAAEGFIMNVFSQGNKD